MLYIQFPRLACSYFLFVSCDSGDMRSDGPNIQGHSILGSTVIQLSVNKNVTREGMCQFSILGPT